MLNDTEFTWVEDINRRVNNDIAYATDDPNERLNGLREEWNVQQEGGRGDCDDYVMTKRYFLRDQYPQNHGDFRIATCWDENNAYHAVLLVDFTEETWVLDNRHTSVKSFNSLPYKWHKIQRPDGSWFQYK